ncbi:DinB family protein [Chloroflexota bacterium]
MNSIKVFAEIGKKRVFIGAVDWPGWCRSGRDEKTAIQALIDYGPRYAQVLHSKVIEFQIPTDTSDLIVIERHDGNATTDFGAPAIMLDADREPIDRMEFERLQTLLLAYWQAFDSAVGRAADKELRKGPRGGGRDIERILDHVLEADQGYLARLAWKHKREGRKNQVEELSRTRQAILNALEVAENGDLPEQGPRGGIIWPARYFIRRVAWHVLDHAWEIDDRIV